jgi:hypothetical protein
MKVFTLTRFHRGGNRFSSATCIFKSFRVGFPTADHIVYDNASVSVDWPCYSRYWNEVGHWRFLEEIINFVNEPICFVDPDVVFYADVESKLKNIDKLVAGRYCPHYWNPVEEANEVDRLHTSLLYISDPKKLRELIKLNTCKNYTVSPYQGFHLFFQKRKFIYDTFANAYHKIGRDNCYHFEADILDSYTHLISGSMLDYVSSRLPGGERLKELHKMAERAPESVRGFWKENDEFYRNNPPRK